MLREGAHAVSTVHAPSPGPAEPRIVWALGPGQMPVQPGTQPGGQVSSNTLPPGSSPWGSPHGAQKHGAGGGREQGGRRSASHTVGSSLQAPPLGPQPAFSCAPHVPLCRSRNTPSVELFLSTQQRDGQDGVEAAGRPSSKAVWTGDV